MTDRRRELKIGGSWFEIDRGADVPYRRARESKMVPRREVTGVPNAENLNATEWLWSISDFSGGEGRLVHNSRDLDPPHYRHTDGGVDVRTKGEFRMSPSMTFQSTVSGSTTTRTQGSALTKATGNETVVGSNLFLDADNEGGYIADTPGAVSVTVAARFVGMLAGDLSSVTVRLRIHNQTDGTTVGTSPTAIYPGSLAATLVQTFTGVAGKDYRYFAEMSAGGLEEGSRTEVDYVDVESGGTPVIDPRALQVGHNDEVWVVNDDGTSSDVFIWDFTNNEWTLIHGNITTSDPACMANSDKYQYIGFKNGIVYRFTDTASSGTQYTAATNGAKILGMAVANTRLYVLGPNFLYEVLLDQTSGLPLTENTSSYKRIATGGTDYLQEETPNEDLRQRMTAIDNGVRFFMNARGGPTTIYEFSEGAIKPIAVLERGYKATAIKHYSGVTWIGVQFESQASGTPFKKRAAFYYIGVDGQLRFGDYFRFHEPDDEIISNIETYGHDVFFLQGNRLWRYDGRSGGLVLEKLVGSSDDTVARGLAVMDNKAAAAYEGVGVFVSEDEYPTDEKVWLYSPVWDWDVPHHDKTLLSFEVVTDPLPANTSVELQYDLDESGTWTSAGIGAIGGNFATPDKVQADSDRGSGTSASAAWPQATADDNLLILFVAAAGTSSAPTFTTPSGWTLIHSATTGNLRHSAYKIEGASSRSGSESVTISASSTWNAHVAEFSGVETASAQDRAATNTGSSATASTGTTATTTQAEELLVSFFATDMSDVAAGTPSAPLGWTSSSFSSNTRLAFKAVTTTQDASAESDLPGSVDWTASIVTFKAKADTSVVGGSVHTFNVYGSAADPSTNKGRLTKWRVGLASSTGTDTPVVRSIAAKATVIDYEDYIDCTLLLDDDDAANHPAGQQLSGRKKAEALKTLADNKAIVGVTDKFISNTAGDKDTFVCILEDPFYDLADPGIGSARVRLKILTQES